jgi:hypothetical protein
MLSLTILIGSSAFGLVYLQATCENMLRRAFDTERLRSLANNCRLEFLFVRKEMESADRQMDYGWVRMALKCDYLALTYLLKDASQAGYSRRERLLMLYFRTLFLGLSVQHVLKLNEKRLVLKLTTILHYFATTVDKRVGGRQLDSLAA